MNSANENIVKFAAEKLNGEILITNGNINEKSYGFS